MDARTPLDEAPTAFADGSDAVRVRGLVKRYKDVVAVDGIDLTVKTGETFGFLGPNGAGKSTTINILCTLVEASEGTAEVAGLDVARERDAVRRNIGLVFQEPTLDGYLTAEQNLRFHGDLYGVDRATAAARRKEVLDMVGLWDRRKDLVRTFSGGMRRRLEIARGLLHSPHVLFLDEPTIGLDPQTRTVIWHYIHELHKQGGDHRLRHHPLHGRGRKLRPHRHHERRQDRRAGHARGAEGGDRQGPRADLDGRRRPPRSPRSRTSSGSKPACTRGW